MYLRSIFLARRSQLNLMMIVILLSGMLASAWPARVVAQSTTTIFVTSTLDQSNNDGQCTLREAIIAANKNASSGKAVGECRAGTTGVDVIRLPEGVYTLTRTDNGREDSSSTGDLDILADVTIIGDGPDKTIIRGKDGFTDRVFHILGGNVSVIGISIEKGRATGNGGGIFNQGNLTLENTIVRDSSASVLGGGVYNANGRTLMVTKSTVANNTASSGGGLANEGGTLVVTNSTISGNASSMAGGGLLNTGAASFNNLTITKNNAGTAGGGVDSSAALSYKNSILAGNTVGAAASDCRNTAGSAFASQGYNLAGSATGCPTVSSDLAVDPALVFTTVIEPQLSLHKGALIHALIEGSLATDSGNPAAPGSGGNACEATDQRGAARPRGRFCDIGAHEGGLLAPPVLIRAFPENAATIVQGRISGGANVDFSLQFYAGQTCSDLSPAGGAFTVKTDQKGQAIFRSGLTPGVAENWFVAATLSDASGDTSPLSECIQVGRGNDSWVTAFQIQSGQPVSDFLDKQGQSRWYKVIVQPNSKVIVTLSGLPANFDLTLYKDISKAFTVLTSNTDLQALNRLGAEFAPDAFSPDAFSPDAFSPDAFSPDAFSPDAFSPDAFSPDAFSPDAFSPDAFSPDAFSPDAFSPDAFSPDAFSPDAFSPDAFSPDAFSPDAFSPDAFSSAQTRSLIGVSAFDGNASEGIIANTWDNIGFFYARVRGRNGAFSLEQPFQLTARVIPGACMSVTPTIVGEAMPGTPGGFKTIILSDLGRLKASSGATEAEINALGDQLGTFAGAPGVGGVVVDVSQDPRVVTANNQADDFPACPFAKNLVAEAIKDIVDNYRNVNPLEYVVIIGNDDVIPFFRHADNALLANEKNYAPPVRDTTASQASLKLGYLLSQDRYGSQVEISIKTGSLPYPDLAVGRLVETVPEISGMLQAYPASNGGVLPAPANALVTGYDFLADAAQAVAFELSQVAPAVDASLVNGRATSPLDEAAWNADQLREKLLGNRYDMVFLAGHFSSGSALAADYQTRMLASELASSGVNLENSIVFSAGCHSGYNLVNPHGIPFISPEPDWAQAFAQKRATLIAGTGYQYGDTDFIEYSERLYLEFSRQFSNGSGNLAVGKALVAAKQAYMAGTSDWRGIHEKALLQATLFGLPMLSVALPGSGPTAVEGNQAANNPAITPDTFDSGPGSELGLMYADFSMNPQLTAVPVTLHNPADPSQTQEALYLQGPDGVTSNPAEPVLPLDVEDASVASMVLRGVGFRQGDYLDTPNVTPLTGAPATEVRGVHLPFLSNVLFPVQWWGVNYYGALAGGSTQLAVTPAQYKSVEPGSPLAVQREHKNLTFRLYYSDNTQEYPGGSVPALAASPSISRVSANANLSEVKFSVRVAGNPAAGIQEVWVTYTALNGPFKGKWRSLDLAQDPGDSTLWLGNLAISGSTNPSDIRYMVQAANGVGLVSLATNLGAFYHPEAGEAPAATPTTLSLETPASSGRYGTKVTFNARLTSSGSPLSGAFITFSLGPQTRQGKTGPDGLVSVTMPLLGLPDEEGYQLLATFGGNSQYESSFASTSFVIQKQDTKLNLKQQFTGHPNEDKANVMATLTDHQGRRLREQTVFFLVIKDGQTLVVPAITDLTGQAILDTIPFQLGTYQVIAQFSGDIALPDQVLRLEDDRYNSATASLINCSAAQPNQEFFWPPNNGQIAEISILNVTASDGSAVAITIVAIFQDEPVGTGTFAPDGFGIGTSIAGIRIERDGTGNGRVYHIYFTGSTQDGDSCLGKVRVGISDNQGQGIAAIDGGPLFDSTVSQ